MTLFDIIIHDRFRFAWDLGVIYRRRLFIIDLLIFATSRSNILSFGYHGVIDQYSFDQGFWTSLCGLLLYYLRMARYRTIGTFEIYYIAPIAIDGNDQFWTFCRSSRITWTRIDNGFGKRRWRTQRLMTWDGYALLFLLFQLSHSGNQTAIFKLGGLGQMADGLWSR